MYTALINNNKTAIYKAPYNMSVKSLQGRLLARSCNLLRVASLSEFLYTVVSVSSSSRTWTALHGIGFIHTAPDYGIGIVGKCTPEAP